MSENAEVIAAILIQKLKLFHTPQRERCAVVPIKERLEQWDIDSEDFKDYARTCFQEGIPSVKRQTPQGNA